MNVQVCCLVVVCHPQKIVEGLAVHVLVELAEQEPVAVLRVNK